MREHFFGYGSLVNRATHGYGQAEPARLRGWRRVWVHTAVRPLAYLSVERDAGTVIDGLIAHVPGGDWAALDAREHGYSRHVAQATGVGGTRDIQVYAVPVGEGAVPVEAHPILLSYIDVVVQGFLREFGPAGAEGFFASTRGWDAPILDDRAKPQYPRAQVLTGAERRIVDAGLMGVGARVG
ncbi:gamma-glutamylcyclotransferase family protein [Pseudorhodobacter ferrugineus]|uniref:gamma-glutamylcyclotransferase family protein n=1 Tax=Pseudorhodobacter ferrugineus TaxID=77008 RepID=UPI0003B76A08|nr:gamma-glutamylcyclotransferase family protein [Pseudorhodobacter ferrugineus]